MKYSVFVPFAPKGSEDDLLKYINSMNAKARGHNTKVSINRTNGGLLFETDSLELAEFFVEVNNIFFNLNLIIEERL